MSGDSKTSTPRNPVDGDQFKYLPSEASTIKGPVRVASIYFSTDEPRKTLRKKNEDVGHQCTHPEEYLEMHAKMALKELFLPIDGGWDGDPTKKKDPTPEGYLQPTLREACIQLAGMRWKFKATADPRESMNYNIDLSKDRARIVACFAMKYLWENGDVGPGDSSHVEAMKGLLDWWDSTTGKTRDQRQKQWTQTHWDSVAPWRVTTWWNIWHNFTSRSVFFGDGGMDPEDLDQEEWPNYRSVDVEAYHATGSAERDWHTGCRGRGWLGKEDYVPEDKENWVAVIMPGQLINFNEDLQFQEDWDPGADPDNVTPRASMAGLLWLMQYVSKKQEEYEQGTLNWDQFAKWIVKIIYEYRYFRLLQHEFLRGNTPPEGKGPGYKNPGTSLEAHGVQCKGTAGSFGDRFKKLIKQSERGQLIFGGNINDPGLKKTRQIAHQYLTRNNPWYRVAYMEEIPGSTSRTTNAWYPDLDGQDPKELYHWPELGKDEITDLDPGITEHLDPVNHGNLDKEDAPNGRYWANGIPKALTESADYPDPDGYMSGEKHYAWLAKNGGYGYDDLAYMDDDNPILTESARDDLETEYEKRNGDYGVTARSHLEQIRYTVRKAMIVVKAQISDESWQRWVDEVRNPYPDYTDDTVWEEWKDPLPSPLIGQ